MSARAVALLSGGLDSILAIRVLQQQGIETEAINFQTIFTCCKDTAARAARDAGADLTTFWHEGGHDLRKGEFDAARQLLADYAGNAAEQTQ